jgi:hypothetical protein
MYGPTGTSFDGVLLFGLNESRDFWILRVGFVRRLQEDITHLASSKRNPTLQAHFLFHSLYGHEA